MAMDKKPEEKQKKKGFLSLFKESIMKTSEGCGPECGCHAADEKDKVKGSENTKDNNRK